MKKLLLLTGLFLAASSAAFADNFNSISIQGQLSTTDPITNVQVRILSAGQIVGTASDIDLLPDANGIFSTQTYITNPWVFQTGSDYTMQLSTGSSPITVISTFSITAVPFALTVRGDAQTGDQNIFGAYGNVGIGTSSPSHRLEISGVSGSTIVAISAGAAPVITMDADGGITASKYYGDGSALIGISTGGDNLGDHTAEKDLNLADHQILNVSSLSVTGGITAASYQVSGATILSRGTQARDLLLGKEAGSNLVPGSSGYNTYLGDYAGQNAFGGGSVFVGYEAGSNANGDTSVMIGHWAGQNNSGNDNIFIGSSAGRNAISGDSNIIIGIDQQLSSANPNHTLNIGGAIFGNLLASNIGIGASNPQSRLVVTGDSGTSGDVVVIATGTSNMIRMTGAGEIYAGKYYGDGSGLSNVASDNLGDHVAREDLDMNNHAIINAHGISLTSALDAKFRINGVSVLGILEGYAGLSVGSNAGANNTSNAHYNSFIGHQSGYRNTTGRYNSFVGAMSGYSNVSGENNSVLGTMAGYLNTAGSANTILGTNAGYGTSGNSFSSSTLIGYNSGRNITTGSNNVLLGFQAGDSLTDGSNNIIIGYDQDPASASSNNSINIGGVIFGDLEAKTVGISTRVPEAALDIVSTGTASNIYAQIWRDGSGNIVSSMTSQGTLFPQQAGDNLGNHTATKALDMANNSIINVSTLTVSGNAFSVGGSTLVVDNGIVNIPNANITSASISTITGDTTVNGRIVASNALTVNATSAPAGIAGKGVLYYDNTLNVFMVKENNGAPKPIVDPPGNWTCATRIGTSACTSISGSESIQMAATATCAGNEKMFSYVWSFMPYNQYAGCATISAVDNSIPSLNGASMSGQSITIRATHSAVTSRYQMLTIYANCCQ